MPGGGLSFDLLLWVLAAGLGGAAAWMTLPRPVALDWELYFKLVLVTVLRGEVEAAGGDAGDWAARCRARLWYHPGGRDLAAKLADPAAYSPEVPARPGERALLEALARVPPEDRASWLLERGARDERLYDDPAALGEPYELERALGPGASWDALADWSEPLVAALRRRNAHNVWAVLGEGPLAEGLAAALGEALGEAGAAHLSGGALRDPDTLARALDALLPSTSARLVLAVLGSAVGPLLRCLHGNPGLRDRVRALVGVGVALGPERAWLREHFDHEQLDTEISRAVPYAHLGFLTPGSVPPGEPGLALADTRFPSPPVPASGRASIEAVELGPLIGPAEDFPPALLARGLLVTTTARLALNG